MLRLTYPLIIALALTAGAGYAQQPTPDEARLRSDITYLSSDDLGGRRTGTPGADRAAAYLAGQFKKIGLIPPSKEAAEVRAKVSGELAAYYQTFPYVASVALGKNNSMLLINQASTPPAAVDLHAGEDWQPLGWSGNTRLEHIPVTFAGYGIAASALNRDDYAGANVSGGAVLVFGGAPDGDNPHGELSRYGELRWKAAAARDHGARALIVVAREDNFRDDRLTRLSYDQQEGDAGIAVVVISRAAARRMLAAGGIGRPLEELEKASAKSAPATALKQISLTMQTEVLRTERPAANVVGLWRGSDPQLRDEYLIFGAHYDHLGSGGAGSLAAREGEVHHGADDNASGSAALLELARLLVAGEHPPRRSVLFIAFGGEEEGLLGSNFYVNHPVVPLAQTVAMINLDMVGRLKENRLIIGGVGTAEQWRTMIQSAAQNSTPAPHFNLTLNEDGFGPSDHSSFYAKQIPVLFLWTGTHEDYHKPSDTADKINYAGEARIVSFVNHIAGLIDANPARPTYTLAKADSSNRSVGFRVYLGTIPNYADSTDGVRLDGVRDSSPAQQAGLRAGDRIVKLAGRGVRNVYDYTYALAEMKPGQEYEVEIVRGGNEKLTIKITPTVRK